MSGLRILLADDHAVVRSGLRHLLQSRGHLVIGEASQGEEALHLAAELRPDLILLDLAMPPGMDGLEVTRALRARGCSTPVVVLTMYDDDALRQEVMRAGAQAYVLKQAPDSQLLDTLASLLPEVSPSSLLTQREMEVFRLAAEGYGNKEIAVRLEISVKTVESHRSHVFLKLGLNSRADVVRLALDWGLLSSPQRSSTPPLG